MAKTTTKEAPRQEATEDSVMAGQVRALAALPENIALMKIERETVNAMAVARPRSVKKILAEIVEEFELCPAFAAAAIYQKPVGKAFNQQTKQYDGEQQYAKGLSIRAAEMLFTKWGYTSVRNRIDDEGDGKVRVTSVAFDAQAGNTWEDSGVLSRYYKNRSGQMVMMPEDRFYNVLCRAEISKRAREVLLRLVSPVARYTLLDAAEAAAEKTVDEKWLVRTIAVFHERFNVSQEQLEVIIGRPMYTGNPPKVNWTTNDKMIILGVFNRINDGESTAEEVIREFTEHGTPVPSAETVKSDVKKPDEEKPTTAAPPAGAVKPEDFAEAKEVKEPSLTAYRKLADRVKAALTKAELKRIREEAVGDDSPLETQDELDSILDAIARRRQEIEMTPPE